MLSDDPSKPEAQHDPNVVENFGLYLDGKDSDNSRLLQHQLKAETARREQFSEIVCWGIILVCALYSALILGVGYLIIANRLTWELVAIMSFAFGLPAYSLFYTLTRATKAPLGNNSPTPTNKNEDDYISNQVLQDGAKLVERILKAARK